MGLDTILPSLTSNMGQAMGALHDIQTATIKAGGKSASRQSSQFKEIRENLFQYWDSIAKVLKKGNSFASEVTRLQGLSQTSDQVEIDLLLQELIISCKNCRDQSQGLVEKHKAPMQQYSQYEAKFTATLRTPTSPIEKKRRSESPGHLGEEAMARFGKACEGLWEAVKDMAAFFEVQLAKCKRFLNAVQGRNKDVSVDETRQFANQWLGYQALVLKAYVDISTICDAVTVSPDVTPLSATLTRDSEGRSAHWFEELWHIFTHLLGLQHSSATA
jgi:hypothetical protein